MQSDLDTMTQRKSWKLTITRNVTCRQPSGVEVTISAGTYSLCELTDITYSLSDPYAEVARLFVSQVSLGITSGSMLVEGRSP